MSISLVKRPNGSPVRTAQGPEPIAAAPRERHLRQPLPAAVARQADDPPRKARGQRRLVPQLDPRLGDPVVVLDPIDGLEHLTDVRPRVEDAVVGTHVVQATPRVEPRADEDGGGQVDEEEEEGEARAEGRDHQRGGQEQEPEVPTEVAHRSPGSAQLIWARFASAASAASATGTEARISLTICSGSTSRSDAWLFTMRRCARTATASCFTSSGIT